MECSVMEEEVKHTRVMKCRLGGNRLRKAIRMKWPNLDYITLWGWVWGLEWWVIITDKTSKKHTKAPQQPTECYIKEPNKAFEEECRRWMRAKNHQVERDENSTENVNTPIYPSICSEGRWVVPESNICILPIFSWNTEANLGYGVTKPKFTKPRQSTPNHSL